MYTMVVLVYKYGKVRVRVRERGKMNIKQMMRHGELRVSTMKCTKLIGVGVEHSYLHPQDTHTHNPYGLPIPMIILNPGSCHHISSVLIASAFFCHCLICISHYCCVVFPTIVFSTLLQLLLCLSFIFIIVLLSTLMLPIRLSFCLVF